MLNAPRQKVLLKRAREVNNLEKVSSKGHLRLPFGMAPIRNLSHLQLEFSPIRIVFHSKCLQFSSVARFARWPERVGRVTVRQRMAFFSGSVSCETRVYSLLYKSVGVLICGSQSSRLPAAEADVQKQRHRHP